MKNLWYLTFIIVSWAVTDIISQSVLINMVQKSQEESFRRSLERDADLLLKLGKIEQLLGKINE
jgi:hypothetical protein